MLHSQQNVHIFHSTPEADMQFGLEKKQGIRAAITRFKQAFMATLLNGITQGNFLRWFTGNCLIFTFLIALAFIPSKFIKTADAAEYNVNCSAGIGDVDDLIAAIKAANANPGSDTIYLGSQCTYTLTDVDNFWFGPNGLPPISSEIIIIGNGATIQRDEIAQPERLRFFYIGADPANNPLTIDHNTPGPGNLTLVNLTLRGGRQRGGDSKMGGGGAGMGGAIFNHGRLTINNVNFVDNETFGGNSGIGSGGVGGGMGGDGFGGPVTPAGSSGFGGGGDFGEDGIDNHLAETGGGGGGFGVSDSATGIYGGGNRNGLGGGRFSGNGSGAGYSTLDDDLYGSKGGGVGGGGGIRADEGGGGGFGGGGGGVIIGVGGDGGFGGGAGGAGWGCDRSCLPFLTKAGFGGGSASEIRGTLSGGGGGGFGGALFNHSGTVEIINSIFTGNLASGGTTIGGCTAGAGFGAAFFNLNGTVTIHDSDFFDNTVTGSQADGIIYNLAYDGILSAVARLTITGTSVEQGTTGGKVVVNYQPEYVSYPLTNKSTILAEIPPYDAPTSLLGRAISSRQVFLVWEDNSVDETSFRIENRLGDCSDANVNPWTQAASVAEDKICYINGKLTPGTLYSFRVAAENDYGFSEYSNCVQARTSPPGRPASPRGLVARTVDANTIDVRWKDMSSWENSFRIYRFVNGTGFQQIGTVGANVTFIRDKTAYSNDTTNRYAYAVRACNAAGCSVNTYFAIVPVHLSSLVKTEVRGRIVDLEWDGTAGGYETGFKLERKSGPCGDTTNQWVTIQTLPEGTTTTEDTAPSSGWFSYRLRAFSKTTGKPYALGFASYTNCVNVNLY